MRFHLSVFMDTHRKRIQFKEFPKRAPTHLMLIFYFLNGAGVVTLIDLSSFYTGRYNWVVVYDTTQGAPRQPHQYTNSDLTSYESYKAGSTKPYITGYLTTIPANGIFVVGDEMTYVNATTKRRRRDTSTGIYLNGKLEPEREYKVFQRGFVTDVSSFIFPLLICPGHHL